MKCVLSWCHAEAALPVICAEHVWQWDESHESISAPPSAMDQGRRWWPSTTGSVA
jgi:hypothetical protein